MPEKTARIYSLIAGEVIRMERGYLILRELMTPSETRQKLLAKSGRNAFRDIKNAYRDLFPTNLFKLVDKAKDGEDYNMTLKGLIRAIQDETSKDISELSAMILDVNVALRPLSIHRMKRTGHFSLNFANDIENGNGPPLSLGDFRCALDAIELFLDAVRALFVEGSLSWEVTPVHFINTLMSKLAKAEEYDQLVQSGEISQPNWQKHLEENRSEI
ncbi:hypothetical protein [Thalassobacterium sedimentorum]|nr:hypothetical protein [Coraliomargarita sp. SDUM461004]